MKFLHLTIIALCLTHIANALPLGSADVSTEKAAAESESSKTETKKVEAEEKVKDEKPLEVSTATPKLESTTVAKKDETTTVKTKEVKTKIDKNEPEAAETKSTAGVKVAAPASNPSDMNIKSWGPKDYEYSFKTENQMQSKKIHIEDKPENEENPYDVSDKGSFSTFNADQGYEYKVEYTAGSDGFRPKVSFSFHS